MNVFLQFAVAKRMSRLLGKTIGMVMVGLAMVSFVPAVVPIVEDVVWSRTTSATPTFFFEVPAELTKETPLEFMIQDDKNEYVFRRQFAVDAEAGLLAVPTWSEPAELETGESETATGLAFDESYSWTFSIYCDENRPSAG